jgi:hypothetical protein
MKRKFTSINILVLGFYLFYALSPLMYSIESAQAADQSENQTCASFTDYRSRAVDDRNLLLVTAHEEDGDSTSVPVSRVLLKKKKAVSASFKSIIGRLSLCYVKFFEYVPSSDIANGSTRISDECPICPRGFQRYHSGISPPSA